MKWKLRIPCIIVLLLIMVFGITQSVVAESNDYVKIYKGFSVDEKSNGYRIPEGSTIYHSKNGITEVLSPDKQRILKVKESETVTIKSPGGTQKANRIYEVPSGTYIDNRGDTVYFYLDGELILTVIDQNNNKKKDFYPPPETGGWVEAAGETGKEPDYLYSEWTVPSDPYNPQSYIVNYIFPCIQPWTSSSIIQPVLEWNYYSSGAWTIAPWYVWDGGSARGSGKNASEGDSISGYMDNWGLSWWEIRITNDDTSQTAVLYANTNISVDPLIGHNLLIALETYHATNGNIYNTDVPGTTDFDNISITKNGNPINIQWSEYLWDDDFPYLTDLDVTWSGVSDVILHTAYD